MTTSRLRQFTTSLRLRILMILSFLVFTPYLLALLYLVIQPPSTIMLARWMTGKHVEWQWVPLASLPGTLKATVVAAEDDAFCQHFGVDFRQMGKSISRAQANGRAVKATSTITQQLAKNLFLWPGRSWLRKILEAPLAFWLELTWTKAQILEAYLNVVEWGDGIFGASAAARHYFGVPVGALSYQQAAMLATALPNPLQRHAARPGPAQRAIAAQLVARMGTDGPDLSCIK